VTQQRTGRPEAAAPTAGGRVAVGRINAPWGLRGHVKVTPLTSNPERLQPGSTLLVDGEPQLVVDVVYPSGYPCMRFEGYPDRNAVERLRGTLIEIDEAELPELAGGEYYVHDLVGLVVVTAGGARLGELVEVLRTGANDVYIVRERGRRDVLLPAIAEVVVEVDLAARRMVVEPLPGLIEGLDAIEGG
jgi:16S rRNA processing protein RimM